MEYVSVGIIIVLGVYQCTISYLINRDRDERRKIQYQIDENERENQKVIKRASDTDPKYALEYIFAQDDVLRLNGAKCIYWKDEDVTLDVAKEWVCAKKKAYDSLLVFSPFDRLMVYIFE